MPFTKLTALQRFLNARARVTQALGLGKLQTPAPDAQLHAVANIAHQIADLLETTRARQEVTSIPPKVKTGGAQDVDDDELPAH